MLRVSGFGSRILRFLFGCLAEGRHLWAIPRSNARKAAAGAESGSKLRGRTPIRGQNESQSPQPKTQEGGFFPASEEHWRQSGWGGDVHMHEIAEELEGRNTIYSEQL